MSHKCGVGSKSNTPQQGSTEKGQEAAGKIFRQKTVPMKETFYIQLQITFFKGEKDTP